jgi:hypothetical protein
MTISPFNNILVVAGFLESFRSLKDKTYKILFETSELSPEKLANLGTSLQKAGYLAFKADPFKTEELNTIDSLESDFEDTEKSPSKRLKAVFYCIWRKEPEGYSDFNLYYKFQMEKIITHFKTKLD